MPTIIKTAIAAAIACAASIIAPCAVAAQAGLAPASAPSGALSPASVSIAYSGGLADAPVAIMESLRLVERQLELAGGPAPLVKYARVGSMSEAADEMAAGRANFASTTFDRLIADHVATHGDVKAAGGMLATSAPGAGVTRTFLAGSGSWARQHPEAAAAVQRALALATLLLRTQPMTMGIVSAAGGRPGNSAVDAMMLLRSTTFMFDFVPQGLDFCPLAIGSLGKAGRCYGRMDLVLPQPANPSGD